jgi:hypothetical protein
LYSNEKKQQTHQKDLKGKRGTGKVPKYFCENKHSSMPASPNPMVEGEATLFGVNHEQQTARRRMTKPKIK